MKRKRGKSKDNIFVTNDYFKRYGISRQVVEYQRRIGKINPFSELKGMKLYYLFDADLLVFNYWMENFKKFVFEFEETERMKEECNQRINEILNKKKKPLEDIEKDELEFLIAKRDRTSSSPEFHNLMKLIQNYYITDPEVPYVMELNKPDGIKLSTLIFDIKELAFRLAAYKESKLELDEYLRKEKLLREGRDYYMIYEEILYQKCNLNSSDPKDILKFRTKYPGSEIYKSAFQLLGIYGEHMV